jgi:hypothetical protein
MALHLSEKALCVVQTTLPATKLGKPGDAVGCRERPAGGEVLGGTSELLLRLAPRAMPRQHAPIVGAALPGELTDPQACGEPFDPAAPLRLAVVVPDPLTGVDT